MYTCTYEPMTTKVVNNFGYLDADTQIPTPFPVPFPVQILSPILRPLHEPHVAPLSLFPPHPCAVPRKQMPYTPPMQFLWKQRRKLPSQQ
ncbi:hypothetical protein K402DRAFT_8922 [Aulographum hederae CBS 113979]|uniref:Uncharacterized protein n=1 Tax=Aulographum hederae CBS 113979 TaxID=1176131 RepID=A0A6G1HHC1_9PEZI|nr:hypothetical protein K402DRAFT_8922 [Aulographum hederae CBS 113979]